MDCSLMRALWMLLVFAVKRLPALTLPLLTGYLIDAVGKNPTGWWRAWPLILVQFVFMFANVPLNTYYVSQLSQLTRRPADLCGLCPDHGPVDPQLPLPHETGEP